MTSFNASKTTALFFSRVLNPFSISFCGHQQRYSENHKHVGCVINNTLDFGPHVQKTCKKEASSIFLLRRLSARTKNRTILLKVYKAFTRPLFEYALPALAGISDTL
jgi:hypothetical protein